MRDAAPSIETRFTDRHTALSVWRFDADMIVCTHLADLLGHDSRTLHLRRRQDDGLFDRYASHIDHLWDNARNAPRRAAPGLRQISEPGRPLRLHRPGQLREGPIGFRRCRGRRRRDHEVRHAVGVRGNAGLGHPPVRTVEVIDAKEEPDPSGCLMTDRRALVFSIGAGQQKPGLRAGGRTTTQRFDRPSVVSDGESSMSSNPSTPVKKAMAGS